MEHLKLAMPGLALIAIQLIGLVVPQIFYLVNPVYLWIAICTVGLPCLFISVIFWALRLFKFFKKTYVFRIFLAISLIISTIPSMIFFIEVWLHFKPSDGPALGYMGIFYLGYAYLWLPMLIILTFYVTKVPNKTLTVRR